MIVYEDRVRFYIDPNFAKMPFNTLLSAEYALKHLKHFNPVRANRSIHYDDAILERGDTVYFNVADKDRNMVSMIQSPFRWLWDRLECLYY
jgi:gamma-glutamyltranspeptidase / glutathione hydrolase